MQLRDMLLLLDISRLSPAHADRVADYTKASSLMEKRRQRCPALRCAAAMNL